jgi:hypothetical protein
MSVREAVTYRGDVATKLSNPMIPGVHRYKTDDVSVPLGMSCQQTGRDSSHKAESFYSQRSQYGKLPHPHQ